MDSWSSADPGAGYVLQLLLGDQRRSQTRWDTQPHRFSLFTCWWMFIFSLESWRENQNINIDIGAELWTEHCEAFQQLRAQLSENTDCWSHSGSLDQFPTNNTCAPQSDFYIRYVIVIMFPGSYVPRVLCSQVLCSQGSMFPSSIFCVFGWNSYSSLIIW